MSAGSTTRSTLDNQLWFTARRGTGASTIDGCDDHGSALSSARHGTHAANHGVLDAYIRRVSPLGAGRMRHHFDTSCPRATHQARAWPSALREAGSDRENRTTLRAKKRARALCREQRSVRKQVNRGRKGDRVDQEHRGRTARDMLAPGRVGGFNQETADGRVPCDQLCFTARRGTGARQIAGW